MAKYTAKDEARFWAKVIKFNDPDRCWEWTGATVCGYGNIRWCGKADYAHRVSFQIANGFMPGEGLEVCHTCDNPPCTNPNHLFLGTRKDNAQDAIRKGRFVYAVTLRAEESNFSKLSWEEVGRIRRLYEDGGHSQSALAELFGIHQTHVSRIVRYKCWTLE